MSHTIQLFNHIDPQGLNILEKESHILSTDTNNPDAILCRSHNCHELDINPELLAIARAGAGVNNIPCADVLDKGIVVFNTPGANANAVKELVIGALFVGARNLITAHQASAELTGNHEIMSKTVESIKKQFTGFELRGRTLGVIGLGHIGVLVANAALALGCHVIGYDPMINTQNAWQLSAQVKRADDLDTLFKDADFVTVHIPLIEATKHLINKEHLALMKPGSMVANFSRAGIVDTNAMRDALITHHIHRYLCDFPDPCLQDVPEAICFPHLGASTIEATSNCATMAAQQLNDFLSLGHLTHCVHFPNTSLVPSGKTRITVINRNVPNMVAQMSSALSNKHVNINTFINQSQGEYAYNILDVDCELPEGTIKDLENIDGVLRVRMIPL